jgi:DDE superfamily endonuclease
MGRKYKKKTNRQRPSAEVIIKAIREIGFPLKLSVNSIAKKFKFSVTSLQRHYNKALATGIDNYVPFEDLNHRQVFNAQQETVLKEFFLECTENLHGFTLYEARKFTLEFAVYNKIPVPNAWLTGEVQLASVDWINGFRERNPELSLRKAENVSIARIKGFTKPKVTDFFKKLEKVYDKYKYGAESIWNFDESSLGTVPTQAAVIARMGGKNVGRVVSHERGATITFGAFVSASGKAVLPTFIMPRAKPTEEMRKGAPHDSIIACNSSGWNTKITFVEILQRFAEKTQASPVNRQLLLLDSHESHISVAAIELARKHGIDMLTFPPHTTHKLQPLDVSTLGPFKTYFTQQLHIELDLHPDHKISIHQLPGIAKIPYEKSFTAVNIIGGFRKSGECCKNTLSQDKSKRTSF